MKRRTPTLDLWSSDILSASKSIALSLMLVVTQTAAMAQTRERINPDTFSSSSSASAILTPRAREAAVLLGILPKVETLLQMKQARQGQASSTLTDEELALKVDVLEKILGASLEVRMVAGRIDREIAWAYSGHDMMLGKRQRNINYLFTANFMQGGILGVLSGPAFLEGEPTVGTKLLLIASSVGLGLSSLAFLESYRGSKRVDGGTTMLADVFHIQPPAPPDHNIDLVNRYLNSVPAVTTTSQTRVETLMAGWKKGHYLRDKPSENELQKLSAIEPTGKKFRESPALLDSRIRMLFDTQYTVELMHESLLELLRVTELT